MFLLLLWDSLPTGCLIGEARALVDEARPLREACGAHQVGLHVASGPQAAVGLAKKVQTAGSPSLLFPGSMGLPPHRLSHCESQDVGGQGQAIQGGLRGISSRLVRGQWASGRCGARQEEARPQVVLLFCFLHPWDFLPTDCPVIEARRGRPARQFLARI